MTLQQLLDAAEKDFSEVPISSNGKRNGNALNSVLFKYQELLKDNGVSTVESRAELSKIWKRYKGWKV